MQYEAERNWLQKEIKKTENSIFNAKRRTGVNESELKNLEAKLKIQLSLLNLIGETDYGLNNT